MYTYLSVGRALKVGDTIHQSVGNDCLKIMVLNPFLVVEQPQKALRKESWVRRHGVLQPQLFRVWSSRPMWGTYDTPYALSPARDSVPGPVVEVLVSDHALDALVVQVGGRLCTAAGVRQTTVRFSYGHETHRLVQTLRVRQARRSSASSRSQDRRRAVHGHRQRRIEGQPRCVLLEISHAL